MGTSDLQSPLFPAVLPPFSWTELFYQLSVPCHLTAHTLDRALSLRVPVVQSEPRGASGYNLPVPANVVVRKHREPTLDGLDDVLLQHCIPQIPQGQLHPIFAALLCSCLHDVLYPRRHLDCAPHLAALYAWQGMWCLGSPCCLYRH